MAAYEVEIGLFIPLVFIAYYIVYWSFFIVVAVKLNARNSWLALIPGIKIYLLRKMSGREYKTGRSLFSFLFCFVAWLAALPLVAHYSSSGLVFNLVFWGGIAVYLVYRGAILASIATRLGEPPWKAYLYGVPFAGFVFIILAAFSPQRTIHEQLRAKQMQRSAPVYLHDRAPAPQYDYQRQEYAQPLQGHEVGTCYFCGDVNPPEFSECQNCFSPLRANTGRGWK